MAAPTPSAASFVIPANGDLDNNLLRKIAVSLAVGVGLYGVDNFADTGSHTGQWWIIQFTSDTVFSSITYAPGFPHTGDETTATYAKGDRLHGQITAFTLASGSVRAYRAPA